MARPLDTARLGDHLDRLYRAACALTGTRATADDLGYLLRTMRNVFLDQYRTAKRRATDPTDPEDLDRMVRGGGPQEAVEQRELLAAISALPDEFRDVIVAVDVTGLSYKETADVLKVPEGTVMSRLYRARKRLIEKLG